MVGPMATARPAHGSGGMVGPMATARPAHGSGGMVGPMATARPAHGSGGMVGPIATARPAHGSGGMVGPMVTGTVLTIAGMTDGVGVPAFSAKANTNKERTATCANLFFKKLLISKPSSSNVFRTPGGPSSDTRPPGRLYRYPKAQGGHHSSNHFAHVVNEHVPRDGAC